VNIPICEIITEKPFDSRVVRMISKATGEFVAGVANGYFEIDFKPGYRFQSFKGSLVDGMFSGKGQAWRKDHYVIVCWDEGL
jgi:hypothetical protein